MSVGSTISRATGYIRVLALGWALGLGRPADNYMLANVMPNMLYELVIGGILSSVLIPVFLEYIVEKKEDESWYIASIITNITLLGLLIITLLGMMFPYIFVRTQTALVPPGKADVGIVAFYFRFFVPQIIFYGLIGLITAMLNARKHFFAPAFSPILNNIIVVITVVLFYAPIKDSNPNLAIILLAFGTTLGVVASAIAQIPFLFKYGAKYSFSFNWKHPAVKKIGKLALPVIGYVILNQVGLTVANNLAYPYKGGVSSLQYAWPVFMLFYGIFSVSITNALFPSMAESWSKKDIPAFKENLTLGIRTIGFLLIPSAAILITMTEPLIRFILVLKGGEFNFGAALATSNVLRFYLLGLFSFGSWVFMTRTFYSIQDTKTPMLVNAMGVPFNIIVNVTLVRYMGVPGIALGLALTYTFTTLIILYMMRRKVGSLNAKNTIISVGKQLIAGFASAIAIFFVTFNISSLINLDSKSGQGIVVSSGFIVGIIVYIVISYFMRIKELEYVKRVFVK